jgi:hypothetical protein
LTSQVGGSADGMTVSTARAVDGTHSLAVAATFNCARTSFEVVMNPCGQGTPLNLKGKTLTFSLFIDGPAFLAGPVEPSVTILSSDGETVSITPALGAWIPVSVPMTATGDASSNGFGFELFMSTVGPGPGFVCGQWAGTIYLDGFKVN